VTAEPTPVSIEHARLGLFELYRRQGKQVWVQASGESMRPLISPGAWLLVDFGVAPTRVGEIVIFARQTTVVAHRVVVDTRGSSGRTLTTKGDPQLHFDPPLAAGDVIGVVRAVRRGPRARIHTLGCSGFTAELAGRLSGLSGRVAGRLRISPLARS
jgi:hypothetical protein